MLSFRIGLEGERVNTYNGEGEFKLATVEGYGILVAKVQFVHGVANILNDGKHDVLDVVGLVHVALSRGKLVSSGIQTGLPHLRKTYLKIGSSLRFLGAKALNDLVDDSDLVAFEHFQNL
jgi:hypothetical protein